MKLSEISWNEVEDKPSFIIDELQLISRWNKTHPYNKRELTYYCKSCEKLYEEVFIRPDTKEICCIFCLHGYLGKLPNKE